MYTIPHNISKYIQTHFAEPYVTRVETGSNEEFQLYYQIHLCENDTDHRLRFNEHGTLLESRQKPAFSWSSFR